MVVNIVNRITVWKRKLTQSVLQFISTDVPDHPHLIAIVIVYSEYWEAAIIVPR